MPNRWRTSFNRSHGSQSKLPPRSKEVILAESGIEKGSERFDLRDAETPSWAHARVNLTALSHTHNLYFVAYGDTIWVYRPSFPSQRLGKIPQLIIKPLPTGVSRHGAIHRRRPDDINHLITAFLGDDEILLFCSDCGDVWFYYVSRLNARISRLDGVQSDTLPESSTLRPDFVDSVGHSAWGLSVHRKSRKVAVSSNSHQVTIFQLALTISGYHAPDLKDLQDAFWEAPPAMTSLETIQNTYDIPRSFNFRFRLPDSRNNIPCISFCNTDEDLDGRYLAVGDICGNTIRWDLQTLAFEYWTAHFCNGHSARQICRCLDSSSYSHAVWGLYWLDVRQFLKYGWAPRNPDQLADSADAYDITNQMEDVPSSSTTFRVNNAEAVKYPQPNPHFAVLDESESDQGNESPDSNSSNDVVLLPPARRKFIWRIQHGGEPDFPRCPFLWISAKQIAFHQPQASDKSKKPSLVVMRHPMKQSIAADSEKYFHPSWWHPNHSKIQRMSLHASIPELGVIVVATPYGRCAMLSLLQGDTKSGKPYYFYRVDWMLPTREQEESGDRPGFTLMGLSVGPIQGKLGAGDNTAARKWRLMLQYYDFSVLSYEISRENNAVPDLEVC